MTLDQLNAFLTAADLRSISAAARRLNKSQSTLSNAIANLEIDLGVTLFERTPQQLLLTPEGEALCGYARSALNVSRSLQNKAYSLGKGQEHRLRLAIDDALPEDGTFDLLADIDSRFPELHLELFRRGSIEAVNLVRDGQAEIALAVTVEQMPQQFDVATVGHVQFLPVAATSHPLAALPQVLNDDVAQYRQIVMGVAGDSDSSIFNPYSARTWRVDSYWDMAELIARGLGWGLLPVRYLTLRPGLVELPHVYRRPGFVKSVDLVWNKKMKHGTAFDALVSDPSWCAGLLRGA